MMISRAKPAEVVRAGWDSQRRVAERAATKMEGADRLRQVGFYCALALIFLRFSFFSEFITYITGKQTYLLYVFGAPALLAFISRGGLRRTFREKGPRIWLGFLIWMCLTIPLSVWRGGSVQSVQNYVKTEFILLLFLVGLATGWEECRKAIYAIGGATAFLVMVAAFYMRTGEERFSLDWTGQIGNANDLAAHLLLTLPFLLFIVLKPNTRKLVRLILLAPLLLGLFEILRTASRGALIALVVTVAFLLLRGSMKQRIAIGATAAIVLAAMITLLPKDTWNRMLSFSNDDSHIDTGALESSDIREHLLQESIKCTIAHPILGVGVGQFGTYEAGGPRNAGHVAWRPTHNSYTEISSECGIPALVLYLAALVWAFRLLSRISKQASGGDKSEMATAAYVISIGLVAYSIAIFFLNFGYAFQFLFVSGLIETMWRVVRDAPASNGAMQREKVVKAPWLMPQPIRRGWKR